MYKKEAERTENYYQSLNRISTPPLLYTALIHSPPPYSLLPYSLPLFIPLFTPLIYPLSLPLIHPPPPFTSPAPPYNGVWIHHGCLLHVNWY